MRPALSSKFVDKAEAALVAAVEIFNKPTFLYREETFALLAINAWELLLKALILKNFGNDPRSIRVYEPRKTKSGKLSKKKFLKTNRAGAPLTLSIGACIAELDKDSSTRIPQEIQSNLSAIIALRDNSAHYINASPVLAKQALEIASAAVKNFVLLVRNKFKKNLADKLSLTLPLSFLTGATTIDSVVVSAGESKLIGFLQGLAAVDPASNSPYAVAIKVNVKVERSKLTTATKVQISNDPDALKVTLTEEDIRSKYPLNHEALLKKCKAIYSDFKADKKFNALKTSIQSDARLVHLRHLDPTNLKGQRKRFYSHDIFNELDKHYTRR